MRFKRFFCLTVFVAFCLLFAGCSDSSDDGGYKKGILKDKVYSSKYLGLKVDLSDCSVSASLPDTENGDIYEVMAMHEGFSPILAIIVTASLPDISETDYPDEIEKEIDSNEYMEKSEVSTDIAGNSYYKVKVLDADADYVFDIYYRKIDDRFVKIQLLYRPSDTKAQSLLYKFRKY